MNVYVNLKAENISLLREMQKRGWDIYTFKQLAALLGQRGMKVNSLDSLVPETIIHQRQHFKPDLEGKMLVNGVDCWSKAQKLLLRTWNDIADKICPHVDRLRWMKDNIGLDAVLVWTDAIPETRALILTAQELGVQTFEVRHGAWNTYKQGHFECESLVDTVLSHGKEDVDFLRFYGNKNEIVVTGKPSLDWFKNTDARMNRAAIKERFQLPPDRPIIVYGGTWRHRFSFWELEENESVGLTAIINAHKMLQDICNPFLVIKIHPQVGMLAVKYHQFCQKNFLSEYSLIDCDPHLILPAADVLVSHKSSLVPEAMLYRIPAVVFEYRGFNDLDFYENKGFLKVTDPSKLAENIASALLDSDVKNRLRKEQDTAVEFFLGPQDGMAAQRCCDIIHARVASRAPMSVAC